METATFNKISDKIKQLPDFLIDEVSDYIDFLLYKNEKDWYTTLSDEQKQAIEKGRTEIKKGDFYSNEQVISEARKWLKEKQ